MDVLSQKVQELMKELEPKFIEDLHWFHENPKSRGHKGRLHAGAYRTPGGWMLPRGV